MNGQFSRNPTQTQKQKSKKKRTKTKRDLKRAVAHKLNKEGGDEPPAKRICVDTPQSRTYETITSAQCTQPDANNSSKIAVSAKEDDGGLPVSSLTVKKSQMIVGVNCVTRSLERGELCAGLVCLSAKPALVTRHIMMLAVTRNVPFAALPDLSSAVVDVLGDIRSALAIGFKVRDLASFFTHLHFRSHAVTINISYMLVLLESLYS